MGGLGLKAVYGVETLSLVQFEECWSIMQTILRLESKEGRQDAGKEREILRTIELEESGKLQENYNPLAEDGTIFDPGG